MGVPETLLVLFMKPEGAYLGGEYKKGKGKVIPLQAWTGPEGSRRLRLPDFQDNRHMKVVRLSALRTGRLYPPGNSPGTHFC